MKTPICDDLGIDIPVFAFTHCRDVVVEVSRAGGLGVLGAVGFTAEQLKQELDWIDANIGDYPYGVDIVIPQKYEGADDMNADDMLEKLEAMIPQAHRDFAEKLLSDHGVPPFSDESGPKGGLLGWTEDTARPLLDEALKRDNVVLIANALGTPPVEIIDEIHQTGRKVAALCGKAKHALKHKQAGVDIVIAQGSEGGGHTGDVGSIVLWKQVIDAIHPTPVLAAGGIGNGQQMLAAMAMGAAGVWTGSIWLAVEEAEAEPAEKQSYFDATEEDTVRSRSFTGKLGRMLKNVWTDAWEGPESPGYLPMPLQGMVTFDAMRRTKRYAGVGECQKVGFNPVGQVVGQMQQVETCRQVIARLLTEYVDALASLNRQMP
ncbi:Putative monooxygenase [BD1-7 clade bacterium]|uniref:Monooxygenase n=1 Tax=BD1-7 clade bacterium TaxID=2029982 RepID=A0A5S9NLC7_9GAMM|nr:Putative monooxygenase [BD1-7 clade bacterium]CAA0093592.1 Putative monooxygenase [BD1-7 clade bacterium]